MSDASPSGAGLRSVVRRVRDALRPDDDQFKTVNLALQGGGAHGAFTWGVLDRFIEDGRLDFEAISGTSAGAMNAVVLADGLMRGGADGARERLEAFWRGVSREGLAGPAHAIVEPILSFWKLPSFPRFPGFAGFSQFASPSLFNPLDLNPLRDVLEELVDFDRVRANEGLRLFISATNVHDGKIKIFSGKAVTAEAVMASACLPHLFRAVEIDGEAYWDGGYSGNPALFPFFTETMCQDILLVQINPVRRNDVPTRGPEIMERLNELTFNASLLREFRAIDFVNRMLDQGRLDPERYRRNRLHRIDATEALAHHTASTKMDTSWRFFIELRDAGREAAEAWLERHYADIGVRATVDLRHEFM